MKIHLVIKVINGKVVGNFDFKTQEELVKKLRQGILYSEDIDELLRYGYFKYHAGNCKVVFNYVTIEV